MRPPARQRPLEQSMRLRTHADRQHPPFSTRKARAAPEIRRLPEPAIRHRAPKPLARCAVFGAVIACRRNSSVDQQPIVVRRGQRWSAKIAKAMSGGVSSVRNPGSLHSPAQRARAQTFRRARKGAASPSRNCRATIKKAPPGFAGIVVSTSLAAAVAEAIRYLAKFGTARARLCTTPGERLAIRRLLGTPDSPAGTGCPTFGIDRRGDAFVVKRDDHLTTGSGISVGVLHPSALLNRIVSCCLDGRLIDRETGRVSLGDAAAGDADRHRALGLREGRPSESRSNC
jgi:hypothetical protein